MGVALCGCASAPVGPVGLALTDQGKPIIAKTDAAMPSDLDGAVRRAQLQRLAGDLDGATRTLGQLVLIAPDDPRVLGEYGKTLVAKGEADDALAFLAQAIALQPNDWMLYSAQGVAYDQRGNYPAAQAAYNHALALNPGEPGVLSNAGLSRMQAGDLPGAELLLRAAAQRGGDNARIAHNLALVQDLKDSKTTIFGAAPAGLLDETASAAAASRQPIVPTPVQTVAAPTPVAQTPPAPPVAPPQAPLTGIAALAADPTVVMAPIPHADVEAKPAKPKPAPVASKQPVVRPAIVDSPQKVAVDDKPPAKLRPAQ